MLQIQRGIDHRIARGVERLRSHYPPNVVQDQNFRAQTPETHTDLAGELGIVCLHNLIAATDRRGLLVYEAAEFIVVVEHTAKSVQAIGEVVVRLKMQIPV